MQHKVLFTSDMHGNEDQYQKLVKRAIRNSVKSVIIGGDITPKNFRDEAIISGQRHFLDKRLPKFLSPIKKKLPNSKIFLMMGNDDCAVNLDVLERRDPELFQLIHGKRIKLTEDFDIVGYSYVPITPFGLKDWEKFDFSEVPKHLSLRYRMRKIGNYDPFGYKSTQFGLKKFAFTPEMEKEDSIQKDLTNDLFYKDAGKTVYVFHTSPDNTNLDLCYDKTHVGSMAIRQFIEKTQPYLTLHGHIHETVNLSGRYIENVPVDGKTLCLTAGNDNSSSRLAVLVFDLYAPQTAVREVI